ncbi:hypothetical protein LCD36_04590 [Saccharopolyspora sp. 6T]|uniref:hypothetical protein n=1 Tax=Saccharopolyspora sp. 6T TaxID=2877238 RepID=UPI001CD4C3A9|nr:hypothetical protein [Saccharopolyspora sp. 6T]MCA1185730.1 hypothetical protein [Saccharopolyspora sp. 6T]
MFITLILSMVVSAGIVQAGSKGKAKAREYKARTQAWRRAQQAAWNRRFSEALAAGPRNPLWWPFAAGWVAAGTVAAAGGFGVGAVSGAVAGARSGRKLGQIAGENGRRFGETFQAWRKANRGQGDVVELGICGRCKGWIRKNRLQPSAEHGQVCPDCVPGPPPQGPPPWVQEHNEEFEPGAGDPITVVHERRADDEVRRCTCGEALAGNESRCLACRMSEADHWERMAQKAQERRQQAAQEEQHGPIRVAAERIYPDQEEQAEPKGIENTMNALPAGTANGIDTTGEGYTSTVAGLTELAAAITAAKEAVDGFNESLAAHGLDADTLNTLSEMQDSLESLSSDADGLVRHVEDVHNPMAEATAAAGGSHNVATKTWYDGH